jgi:hypothetical protein
MAECREGKGQRTGSVTDQGELVPDARALLGAYVNDHLGGSALGLELLRHLVRSNPGTELSRDLQPLVGQLVEERRLLHGLLERLGVRADPLREGAGWVGEKLARVRFHKRVTRSPDLSRLLELDAMCAGVEGKRLLWVGLAAVQDAHPELGALPLADLEARAGRQREVLERHRLAAAAATIRP